MDRRLTPFSGKVAHSSLRGQVTADSYTDGATQRVALPLVDLLRDPHGARERQLWLGEAFTVIDSRDGHVFGFAAKDGYCGWLPQPALADAQPTHWVAVPATHLYPEPRVQAHEIASLPMGAEVEVLGQSGIFSQTPLGFIPTCHLLRLGETLADPISVAESLLGTPYLWGGNSRAGIDCSGLVQLSLHACGIAARGDADLQEALGLPMADSDVLARGDLLFWKGHVAMVVDDSRLIHANGHSMSVAYEPIAACIARIQASEGLPVRARRRLQSFGV
ncbi:MAG: NlpC/P60 family protein [Cypionkella sp.]